MDNNIMVKVDHVSIRYKVGDFKDIGLKEWTLRHLMGNYQVQNFMAVDDISFELEKGDMLGIVGSNGAGKSTLLKAIAGIMVPTRGAVTVNGTIGALLRLVSGFDGNLTIKENAYLRGAMLGYTRKFMDEVYEQIVDFAELKLFEERPFKQLSSGMQSRLAFSIASMVKPEILILDEVLSVGDGAFQAKSAQKIREIINGGATSILVSHSLAQIRDLCNKVLWLHKGKQIAFGKTKEICDQYEEFLLHRNDENPTAFITMPTQRKTKYDYLVVGAGLFGATFAHETIKNGKKCLVIDRRGHIGGNAYTNRQSGINVHQYGPHIFHTGNEIVWNFISHFADFNGFVNSPLALYHGELYNLPFNMNTFNRIWGVTTPEEARKKIKEQVDELNITEPNNLEEQALLMVGRDLYEKLIRGYTEKQWGRSCTELPASIIRRLPLRFIYDNRYFSDEHQGVPIGGYTPMIQKMLEGADVLLHTNFTDYILENPSIAGKIVYTGSIDEYFHYSLGDLEYRSLRFVSEELDQPDYQGNAVVNYTSADVPYTRIIEHKHFELGEQPTTIITKEYPQEWRRGDERYYPVNNEKNNTLYRKYRELADCEPNVIFGGRLGEYKYFDMDQVIAAALKVSEKEFSHKG